MARQRKLEIVIAGDSRGAERALGAVDTKAGALGGNLTKLGTIAAAAAAAAVAAVGAVGIKAVSAFADFDQGMREVYTLMPGISDEAMTAMADQVKEFATTFGVLPEEVIPALYQALSAGVPPDNVFTFLETAQQAAKGGVTELAVAVDGISSVVNAYGQDMISAGQASDLMFTAVKLGKTTFEELSASLSNVTPIAAALGVNFADVAAALATMTAKGVPTAQATTQLRQMFVELSKEGGKAAEAFELVAGKSFAEFIAAGGDTAQALDVLTKATADSGVSVQDLFGSVEAGQAALTLLSDTKYAENLAAMGDAAGATGDAFDTMNEGVSASMDRVKAQLQVLLIEIGEKLAPVAERALGFIEDLMAAIGPMFDRLAKAFDEGGIAGLFEEMGEMAKQAAPKVLEALGNMARAAVDWLVANGPEIANAIGSWVHGMLQRLGDALPDIIAKLGEWVSGMLEWLGEQFPVWMQKWGEWGTAAWSWIVDHLPDALRALGEWLSGVGEWLLNEGLPAFVEGLKNWGIALWEWVKRDGPTVLKELGLLLLDLLQWIVVDALPAIAGKLLEWAWAFAKWVVTDALPTLLIELGKLAGRLGQWIVFEALPGIVSQLGQWAGAFVSWVWDVLRSLPGALAQINTAIISWALSVPGKIWGAVKKIGSAIWEAIIDGLKSAGRFLGSLVSTIKDAVLDGLKSAWDWLADKIEGGLQGAIDALDRGLGPWINFSDDLAYGLLPRFHTGGTFRSELAGGEGLAILRDGERVIARPDAGSGPGGTVNIYIQTIDPAAAGRAVLDALKQVERIDGPLNIRVAEVA